MTEGYRDPKTQQLYPSEEWMYEHYSTLPEVQKAYPDYQPESVTSDSSKEDVLSEESPTLTIPDQETKEPDVSTAKSRLDYYQQQIDYQEKEAERKKAEYEAEQKAYETKKEEWWSDIEDMPTVEEKRESEYTEIGIDPAEYFKEQRSMTAEIGSLMEAYDSKVVKMEEALVKIEDRPGLGMDLQQRSINERKKEFNIELSQLSSQIKTKMAIMELKSNNFEQARSFVQEAINDYTYDLRLEYEQFEAFVSENKDVIDDLKTEYKEALTQAQSFAFAKWQEEENKAEQIGDLILKYPSAGITFDDSLEEATRKASEWIRTQPEDTKESSYKELYNEVVANGYEGSYLDFLRERGVLGEVARDYTDEEFRIAVRGMKTDNLTYQQVIDMIETDPTIKNKDRAKLIASEIFEINKGKEPESTEPFFSTTGEPGEIEGQYKTSTTPFFETLFTK